MKHEDVQKYVVVDPASGIYRYYRRIPIEVAHLDKRTHVKQSLKTKKLREALERAEVIHRAAEDLWRAMLAGNDNDSATEQYTAAVKAAQSLGFTYRPAGDVAQLDLSEIDERIAIAQESGEMSTVVANAMLGTAPLPSPRISNIWEIYEEHHSAAFKGMSPNQLSEHKVSRERAIRYLQDELGNMELSKIARADVLRYRKWWMDKIDREGLTAYTANRSFSDLGGMLKVIDSALQTSYTAVWADIRIKATNATKLAKRPPFPTEFVANKILARGALDALNEDGRFIVYTMIETGMRLGEVCNLRPQDIRLEAEIPHVEVADRDDRRQKTEYSIRRIPLVGVALWALKQRPQGFPRYQDKADVASAVINKVMKSAGLRPTDRHTVYSFRHTFQDRIENAGASDRMQADLMGHEFGRPRYGDGAEMQRRQQLLASIQFLSPWTQC